MTSILASKCRSADPPTSPQHDGMLAGRHLSPASRTCTTDFIAGYVSIPVLFAMDPASDTKIGLFKRPAALLPMLIPNPS